MDNEKVMKYTEHSLLRYCERLKDRDRGIDAKQYLISNKQMIQEHIEKLFLSSELLYSGKLGATDRASIDLFGNKNGWIFIVDPKDNTIITLYKIDLEVGDDDFNKLYIEKAFQTLKDKVTQHVEMCEKIEGEIKEFLELKNNNLEEIKVLKRHIKILEETNEGLDTFIKLQQSKKAMSELELKKLADKFCAKDSGTNIGKEKI